jgi:energy-coupling factor transporter ATP-binding protein EcfA2
MHSYLISGLHVSSELELPGAIAEDAHARYIDVSIRRCAVPVTLDGATASGPTWEMAGEIFLLRVPRLARFRIAAGRDIAVEIEPGVTDRDAAGFVLGSAFGILLHQRGALVLHGAAVAKDGCAIAICGPSGAGKSTLAAALCRDGCTFVTDDICVVGLDASRLPMVLPDGRQLKLWKESIDRLDLAELRGEAVRESFEKYYIDPSDARAQPSPLSAIYVLREARPPLKAGIERLALPDAMRTLDYEAYRPGIRAKIGQKPEMLAYAAAMLGHARIFLLIRPRGFEHLQKTVAELRAHWGSLDG